MIVNIEKESVGIEVGDLVITEDNRKFLLVQTDDTAYPFIFIDLATSKKQNGFSSLDAVNHYNSVGSDNYIKFVVSSKKLQISKID